MNTHENYLNSAVLFMEVHLCQYDENKDPVSHYNEKPSQNNDLPQKTEVFPQNNDLLQNKDLIL